MSAAWPVQAPVSPRTIACAHCGQPVPAVARGAAADDGAAASHDDGLAFCCAGCDAVWHMLHARGLERYYQMQRQAGTRPNRPGPVRPHSYMDSAQFHARHVERIGGAESWTGAAGGAGTVGAAGAAVAPAARARIELRLDGLKCGACLWLLEALPRLEPGLLCARVDMGRSVIALEWAPARTSLSAIADRVAALGYEVRPLGARVQREEWRRQDRRWLVDIAVAGALSGNAMAIAFALYGAEFAWMDATTRQFLQWTSTALTTLAVFWPGRLFLRNAWTALRTRVPHVDVPIALALLAGLLGGAITTAAGGSGVYFESVTMLVFLLLAGRFVQFRQQRRARHEIELLCALVPQTARRVRPDGSVEEVPTEALNPGDLVEVPPGEGVPADGVVEGADAHLDMQLLTGEARPVRVRAGDTAQAGVRAIGSPVRLRVTAAGDRTRAAAIARMVEEAAAARTPVVEFANRVAGWFLAAVLLLAVVTGVAWWMIEPARAPSVVIALLVVTCPCALGLATPLTMVASLGKAARRGILVRSGQVLERLASPGAIVLDKTGTVTSGRMTVVRQVGADDAVALASVLEAQSTHPIAQAVAQLRRAEQPVSDVTQIPGAGIEGTVGTARVAVGSEAFVRAHAARTGGTLPAQLAQEAAAMARDGLTPVFVMADGVGRAVLGVGDPLRPDAPQLVQALRRRGWQVWLLSGDLPQLAARAGQALGLAPPCVLGGCSPEEKMAFVAGLEQRPVVMVGDGLNDLPAMAASAVGVAVQQGAQTTVARADVALASGGLERVVELLDGARRTMRTVHVNFAISLAYNLTGAALAVTGLINPLIAAVLMPLSGLTVTAVALRMPRFGPEQ